MTETPNLVKEFDNTHPNSFVKEILLPVLVILVIIVTGGLTGYLLNKNKGKLTTNTSSAGGQTSNSVKNGANEIGIKDEKQFPDKATGKIVVNDNKDVPDGTHKLLRPGGVSQTAYLTSSVVDMKSLEGKCVDMLGQTQAAKKAAWFMDVGWVKILDKCPEGL